MAKETLRQYLNRKIKDKGSSLTAEKKKAGKYKSISAAKKAGSLYYTDKNDKVMAAVLASDLKEKTKDTAVKISKRPKIRRRGFSVPSVTVTLLPDKYMDEKPRSSDRGKANRTISRKRKPGGPDPSGLMTPGGRKTYKSKKINKGVDPNKLATPLKSYTYKQWEAMSKAERRKLRLPVTTYPGSKSVKVVQRPLK
tara:strand:- start:422 stop:1009 length:588 start_codon:yes stop_codon:yes gene_type:complete